MQKKSHIGAITPLERRIAKGMLEAKKIAKGKAKGQSASSLLKEMEEEAKKGKVKKKAKAAIKRKGNALKKKARA